MDLRDGYGLGGVAMGGARGGDCELPLLVVGLQAVLIALSDSIHRMCLCFLGL